MIGSRTMLRLVAAAGLLFAHAAIAKPAEEKEEGRSKAQKHAAIVRLRQLVRSEPSILEVQKATLHYYKLEPERINKMAAAARIKGLVPEVEAGIDNYTGHNYSNTRDGLYPILPPDQGSSVPNIYKERVSGSNDQFLWRVRAVWNLDWLVFNAEELDVKSLSSIEENLVREVTTLYFSRRRLLSTLFISPPEDEEEAYYEQLRLDEMTATLDALSGNMFSKRALNVDELSHNAP